MEMNIVIRADASIEIGTGHVMRSLTLAKQLERHGGKVAFICRELEGNAIAYLRSQGMTVFTHPTIEKLAGDVQWIQDNWERDAEETATIIQQLVGEVDLLIVDHYGLDARWEKVLQPLTKSIMVIDDLADRPHQCDLLLDQNYYVDMDKRYDGLVPTHCIQMLGPKHVLLRDEFIQFANRHRNRAGDIQTIFVFFGGTDPSGETIKAVHALKNETFSTIEIIVVVGASNPNRDLIKQMCKGMPNIQLYYQVDNMAELMWKSDVAIGAGGATTWERCVLGLPTMTVVIADNQLEATVLLHDKEVVQYIGENRSVSSETIHKHLIELMGNPAKVRRLSQNSLAIVPVDTAKESIVLQTIKQAIGGVR